MTESGTASSTTLQETQFTPSSVVQNIAGVHEELQPNSTIVTSDVYILENDTPRVKDRYTYTYEPDNAIISQPLSAPIQPPKSLVPSTPSPRVLAPDLLRGLLMALQALDHTSVFAGAYPHGQAMTSESASTVMTRWSEPLGYTARTLTHLCAPGFMFLLGMGIVYFGRSRTKLGWGTGRMVRHFFIRGVALAAVNLGLSVLIMGKVFPVLNMVLLALAGNYFLAGLVWLGINWSEPRLANLFVKIVPESPRHNPETDPLLQSDSRTSTPKQSPQTTAARLSFSAHNILLLALSVVTIWWNIWLDPHQGRCPSTTSIPTPDPSPILQNPILKFLFYITLNKYTISAFPPLAWISPAFLGLLYGRLVLSRSWRPIQITLANLTTSLIFIILFILTRILPFGNLDTNCLAMPEHLSSPNRPQHLASARSFFYTTKYPPSPSFLFFTLSANFLLLTLFSLPVPPSILSLPPLSTLLVFGTSALFFYTVHLPLYSALGALLKALFGHKLEWDDMSRPGHRAWGIGMGWLFFADWLVGLAILWPVCAWYARFKATKGVDSLWRFF